MAILTKRFCVKAKNGDYYGGITASYEKAKELLNEAKSKSPFANWQIVFWYD